jgi:hypothetical protein
MPGTSDPQTRAAPDPQTKAAFYMRAGQSQDELRKLLTSLSVGGLGVFLVILTNERSALLSSTQRYALLWAIGLMALATVFGLIAWKSAGRDFYDKAERGPDHQGRAHKTKTFCDNGLVVVFFIGAVASAFYLMDHVKNPPPGAKASNPVIQRDAPPEVRPSP